MSKVSDIARAIRQSLISANLGYDLALPNVQYKPISNNPYIDVQITQNDVIAADLSHTDKSDGTFSLTANFPADSGTFDVENLLDTIENHYKIGNSFSYDTALFRVLSRSRNNGAAADGWYKQTITIIYNAYLRR